jgi:hypothetical protein
MRHSLLYARVEHPVAQLLGVRGWDGRLVSGTSFFDEIDVAQQEEEAGVPQAEHGEALHSVCLKESAADESHVQSAVRYSSMSWSLKR